jgi:hypothetical protein
VRRVAGTYLVERNRTVGWLEPAPASRDGGADRP